jgi:hypothetical protein
MVVVAHEQRRSRSATVQMPSSLFAAGGQLGAYRFEVHIPAAGQWFAPQRARSS